MAGWATMARARADLLKDKLDALPDTPDKQRLQGRLADVRQRRIDARSVFGWITGNAVNETWSVLHQVEEGIDELMPDTEIPKITHEAEAHLSEGLPRRRADKLRSALGDGKEGPREAALNAIRTAHRAAEERHESERNQQRGMVGIAALLFVGALVLVVLQATTLDGDHIIPPPSEGMNMSGWVLLALVMLLGMVGGLFSALISLYISSRRFANTAWFDPRPGLVLIKLVVGIYSAMIGVLAVGTGEVVGGYRSVAAVLLLAFIFGYGQQALTTFIDRKVASTLKDKTS